MKRVERRVKGVKKVKRKGKTRERELSSGCQLKGVRGTVGAEYNVVCCGLSELKRELCVRYIAGGRMGRCQGCQEGYWVGVGKRTRSMKRRFEGAKRRVKRGQEKDKKVIDDKKVGGCKCKREGKGRKGWDEERKEESKDT